MRNVILYIATSLDGYIARANGQVDWLDAIPNPNQLDYGYQAFLNTIDTTLMGNNTYQTILGFGGPFPYPDTTNYVFSRSEQPAAPYIEYVTQDPVAFVRSVKQANGKAIWLIGGGQLNTVLINAGLIDELIISIAPVVLGSGIPLFGSGVRGTALTLVKSESFETGFAQLTYVPAVNQ